MPALRRVRPLLVAVPLALTGCTAGAATVGAPGTTLAPTPVSTPAAPAPSLSADVRAGQELAQGTPVVVTARNATLGSVSLTAADGTTVARTERGARWTSPAELPPLTRMVLSATAVAPDGRVEQLRTAFRTGEPDSVLETDVYPWGDRVVGVGHPLVVRLDHDVEGEEERAAVERALTVSTSRPTGPAGWAWVSADELHYRPKDFWPADTDVALHVDLAQVRAGDGLWGVRDRVVTFRTGRSQVLRIDDDSHTLEVVRDGRTVRTMGVSMGKDGFITRSGTKVIMSREETRRMRSSTIGIDSGPDSYDLVVPYAMRLTNSGEFLHGAPWNPEIGEANRSHGCVNLELADARWLMANSIVGDPVVTTGTGRETEPYNGLGGDWNYSWEEWRGLSALA